MFQHLMAPLMGLLATAGPGRGEKGPFIDPNGVAHGPFIDPDGVAHGPYIDPNGLPKGPFIDPDGAA